MSFSLVYLIERFFYRIFEFFRHWYVNGARFIGRHYVAALASLDRTFALQMTLRHFFEPLYGDYSVIGRILGVIFRTFRVAIAFVLYAAVSVIALAIAIAWFAIPLAVLFRIIHG